MEGDPFAVVEAMTIAAYATGCERGYVYLRGEYPEALHALGTRSTPPGARGFLGDDVMGEGLRLRRRDPPRRRRVHLRRGDRDLRVDRGQARRAAQQAAVPRRGRPLRQADGRQQRRDARQRPRRRVERSRPSFAGDRDRGLDGDEAPLPLGARRAAQGRTRCRSARRSASCSTWRAASRREGAPGGAAGRRGGRLPRPRRPRRAAHVRGGARGGHDARLGRRARPRRDRRPSAPADADRRVLPQRVVRPVRPVPRGARSASRRRSPLVAGEPRGGVACASSR